MSNTVRNGFSTLNRLLGKKNKNPLSKSATNINKLSTALDTSSQHNQIFPLAASTNAPFEQTFRITICLPLDQLYVVRVGAKTKLSSLLEMVCTNKLLEKDKFEFTHPTNFNQVFDLNLTIGEVGLNEIRLAHKSPPGQTIDDQHNIVKYRHHNETRYVGRPQSMFVIKSIPSPYSSTNSLNSTDSSGINSSLRMTGSHLPVAPTRKKRMAPRPPSQNSIPEDGEQRRGPMVSEKQSDVSAYKRPMGRKDFHVSSPNLSNTHLNEGLKYKDINLSNGNIYTINEPSGVNSLSGSDITNSSDGGIGKSTVLGRPMSLICDLSYNPNDQYRGNDMNGNQFSSFIGDGNHSRTSSEASESTRNGAFSESTTRKKVAVAKKKAPAPPPRTTPIRITAPVPTPRSSTPKIDESLPMRDEQKQKAPIPSPIKSKSTSNITKVMLNVQNLQINIPDDTVIDLPTNQEDTPNDENIFSKKIVHGVTTGSKLTDDEKTAAIDKNASGKNCKNFDKAVRFDNIDDTVSKDASKIDQCGLSKEISDIIEKAIEISANSQNGVADRANEVITDDFGEQCFRDELCKEITNIINKAVEINTSTELQVTKNTVLSGNQTPTDHTVNENDVEDAPGSPQWNYSLPAPAHFAENKMLITPELSSEENFGKVLFKSSPYQKYVDIQKNTDIQIKPTIKKEQHVDNSLSINHTTDTNNASTADQENIITSDIEDGYQGNDIKSKQNRDLLAHQQDVELKREFIENEFEFLSEHDEENDAASDALDEEMNLVNDKYSGCDHTEAQIREKSQNVIRQKSPQPNILSVQSQESTTSKTNIIDELNNIISANRLDTIIKKSEKSDEIDAAKRSMLANFQIRPYSKQMSGDSTKDNCGKQHLDVINRQKRHSLAVERSNSVIGDTIDTLAKPREFAPMKRSSLTLPHGSCHIHRSDSFHSTHIMQQHHSQLHSNGEYTESISLTPRSSSYISLIGTQRYENRTGKQLFGNGFSETTRQKSSSELSIADSPSLQSLVVMKSILSNSRKNNLNNVGNDVWNKSTPEPYVDEADEQIQNQSNKDIQQPIANASSESDDQSAENSDELEQDTTEVPRSSSVSKIKSAFETKTDEEPKKWTYQGPPAISLSTWGERPKSQVTIKSDNNYKFSGIINNKKSLLQNRFSTTAIYDRPIEQVKAKEQPNPAAIAAAENKLNGPVPKLAAKPAVNPKVFDRSQDVIDGVSGPMVQLSKDYERRVTPLPVSECKQELGTLPIVCGVEYKKNVHLDDEFIKNDPIMRAKADDDRAVVRSGSSYEVSRIVNEKPFSVLHSGPSSMGSDQVTSTMTLGRVPIPNKFAAHRQTMNFTPQPFSLNGGHSIKRNSSFTSLSTIRLAPVVDGSRVPDPTEKCIEKPPKPPTKEFIKSTSPVVVKIETYESHSRPIPTEKPAFAQFSLRKTGLKEKIIDMGDGEHAEAPAKGALTSSVSPFSKPASQKPAAMQCSTAEPKRNNTYTVDPRNQLLDSIRNFSKNDLRRS